MLIRLALIACALSLALAAACSGGGQQLILATTTSVLDSGLLDELVPRFERETGYRVKTIAVGSGAALRLGEEGEADALLVHSPDREEAFVAAGHGINRRAVMHNDFVIVGPGDDPAGARGLAEAAEALRRIAEGGSTFVSRGDASGTHAKELALWAAAGIEPAGGWYQETGTGMGQTLLVASEKRGYALSDRGTYLAQRANLDLEVLVEGDPALFNVYHVMQVNPDKTDRINGAAAEAFVEFMTAADTQELIRGFGVERFGQPLFVPDAYVESTPDSSAEP